MLRPASPKHTPSLLRALGRVDYHETWRAMREFTDARTASTPDEIWLLEHPPVYTMGLKGRDGTARALRGIPIVYTDRGGDITYHGLGQIVAYVLMDLRRRGWGIKTLVQALESAAIELLASHGIHGERRAGAPGVYVAGKKIAALGLRVRQGRTYHGLALNVDMDLTPFSRIDPCGYPELQATQLVDLGIAAGLSETRKALAGLLARHLGYNDVTQVYSPIRPELATHAARAILPE